MRNALLCLLALACSSTDTTEPPEGEDDTEVVDTEDTTVDTVDTEDEGPLNGDPCLTDPTVLRWGIGEDGAFDAVSDGIDAFMVFGGQGGWHLPISFEVDNISETVVIKASGTLVSTGETLIEAESAILMVPAAGLGTLWACDGVLDGVPGFIAPKVYYADGGLNAWDLAGEEVDLEVSVNVPITSITDIVEVASATARVVLQPDPCDCDPVDAPPRSCVIRDDPTHNEYEPDYVNRCDAPPVEDADE
jgi:hypothetical protein